MASRYGLEIRAAAAVDAPGLAELMAACGRPVSPHALAARLEAMRAEPGAVLIASEWGPPGGVIALHWRRTLASDVPAAFITALLVGPDDRRRGIGRLLLKAGAQAARAAGCGELRLIAPIDEEALDAFCRATGFAGAGAVWRRPLRKRSAV